MRNLNRYVLAILGLTVLILTTCKKVDIQDPNIEYIVYTSGEGTIGAGGGQITIVETSSPICGFSIDIPQGALANSEIISAKLDNSVMPIDDQNVNIIDLQPNGLKFDKPITIKIPIGESYDNPTVFYFIPDSGIVRQIPTQNVIQKNGFVAVQINHLSKYYAIDNKYLFFDASLYNTGNTIKANIRFGGSSGIGSIPVKPLSIITSGFTILNAKQAIDYGIPYLGTAPERLFVTIRADLKQGRYLGLGAKTLKSTKIAIQRKGFNPSQSSYASVKIIEPESKELFSTEILDEAEREDFFSGKAIVFDFNTLAESGREYYLEISWCLSDNENAYWLASTRFTDLYEINSYDKYPAWTTTNMISTDPDINNDFIFDTYNNKPPNSPSVISPSNGAAGISTSPTLSWSCSDPDEDALTYDVYFGSNSNPITAISLNQSTSSIIHSGLANNTTYYWKVVAKDSRGLTTNSNIWSFTTVTANNPPNLPSSPSPLNGAVGISTSPTLSWICSDPDGDALTYDVYFSTSSNPTTAISINQSTTTISRSGLATNTTYYWWVIARDSRGGNTMSPVWNFTVENPQTGQPDLTILTYTYSPVNPTSSDEITFVATIKNIGSATAGSSQLEFRIGGESAPPLVNVPALTTGQTFTATRKVTLSALAYMSIITVDPNNAITESNEGNNTFSITFTVIHNASLVIPTVTTSQATFITSTSAMVGGAVTSDGGATVTENGFYWGTSGNPVNTGTKMPVDVNTGTFSTTLTSLSELTTYYVVAYAVNSVGEAVGGEISFATTSGEQSGSIIDIEGNTYKTIQIGNQNWLAANLKTTKYNDGTAIPRLPDDTSWEWLETPAYWWYDNNEAAYKTTYGALYNWYTVSKGNLCPTGWHVPTDAEWTTLIDFLGGTSVAGAKMKETGYSHWLQPNTGATNESGFTGLPGGYRSQFGNSYFVGSYGIWWSSTEDDTYYARCYSLGFDLSEASRDPYGIKTSGFSVRCIKD